MDTKNVKLEQPIIRRGGNGGVSDWHGGSWEHPEPTPPIPNAKLGMMLLCVASAMLFVALTGAYIVMRHSSVKWPPVGFPPLPRGLWFNTAIIVASSASMVFAQIYLKRRNVPRLQRALLITTTLGFAFVFRQAVVWRELGFAGLRINSGTYGSSFYVLTIIHALHVMGGLVFLLYATLRAYDRRYWKNAETHIEVCAIYWHFVGALWLFLFTILYLI